MLSNLDDAAEKVVFSGDVFEIKGLTINGHSKKIYLLFLLAIQINQSNQKPQMKNCLIVY